ncbi:hypothetical protein SAMN04488008_104249 [Maribacter orientalis]|uniref:Uncharacterized protein n=1 Tax=Maribacter orientalis TaxID=228957 RepID=A0A1H7RDM6_9FLAO|nr:hypothetical protein [Maribacter orientalis]SEL58058.1 hypothetical protein SAMN04488008_104249 [Maribacter orientalis]
MFVGKDILPQLCIAQRGLITVLLFYEIPIETQVATFNQGILLFVIIGTSLIMKFVMIYDKPWAGTVINTVNNKKV